MTNSYQQTTELRLNISYTTGRVASHKMIIYCFVLFEVDNKKNPYLGIL